MDEWKSQIRRGILEYCILLLIYQKPRYGYEIINEISRWEIITARESTVYPLLRRLQKEGYLDARWGESQQGLPPRKYYALTDSGKQVLSLMDKQWLGLVSAVDHLRKGEEN